jgi:ring-1,2-phenylacetyl-CoA epoxidase subunit PaaD
MIDSNTLKAMPVPEDIWKVLEKVTDPEIPVLTIQDLGIIRDVKINEDGIKVVITPTYSGCPAMSMIALHIQEEMLGAGYSNVTIETVLSPPWTTDWMSEDGKNKLREYGIAPPSGKARIHALLEDDRPMNCPQCGSEQVELVSHFGSTPCKALYRCMDCKEPFDYFKCH